MFFARLEVLNLKAPKQDIIHQKSPESICDWS